MPTEEQDPLKILGVTKNPVLSVISSEHGLQTESEDNYSAISVGSVNAGVRKTAAEIKERGEFYNTLKNYSLQRNLGTLENQPESQKKFLEAALKEHVAPLPIMLKIHEGILHLPEYNFNQGVVNGFGQAIQNYEKVLKTLILDRNNLTDE